MRISRLFRDHRVTALAVYAIVIALVFGPALFPHVGQMLYGDDIHRQYYFYREFFNYWIGRGIFPWWNPNLFGGEPFIANPVVNIWYPPTWLFSLLPLNIAYSWHVYLHIVWASFGMYLLGKQFTKQAHFGIAAWVSGVVFGLSGFFMARTFAGHVDVIAAASWMPWVVGAFYRLMTSAHTRSHSGVIQNFIGSSRFFVIAACVFALQLLSGYQTMAFFTVIAVGMFSILHAIHTKQFIPVARVAAAGGMGILLAAIQILPEQEFFGRSIRLFSFPYVWHAYGALEWRSLLQFLNPFQFGNQFTYNGPPPNFIEHSAYVGLMGLVLSLFGIVGIFRKTLAGVRKVSIAFALLVFFGLWVSLGPNVPIDLQKILWQFIPVYHHIRIPPRHLVLVVFGLAGLAYVGVQGIKNLRVQMCIGLIVVIELILFARGFIALKPIPESRHDKALITLLQKDTTPHRLLQNFGVWVPVRDALDFDGVMAYNMHSATGYDPSILRSYYEFVEALNKSTKPSVLDHDVQVPYMNRESPYISFLGIKHLLVPKEFGINGGKGSVMWKLAYQNAQVDYDLYINAGALERFFFVHRAEFYKTREPIIARLRGEADLHSTVLIRDRLHDEEIINLPCDEMTSSVKIVSFTPNKIELSVETPCDGYLSSSEVFYPGWHATIDGKESYIYESNIAFRTLFVPRGHHTITYHYRPTIFVIGGIISSLSAIFLFWLLRKKV